MTRLSGKAMIVAICGLIAGAALPLCICFLGDKFHWASQATNMILLAYTPLSMILGAAIGAYLGAWRYPQPARKGF
jgi:hypothetical protein